MAKRTPMDIYLDLRVDKASLSGIFVLAVDSGSGRVDRFISLEAATDDGEMGATTRPLSYYRLTRSDSPHQEVLSCEEILPILKGCCSAGITNHQPFFSAAPMGSESLSLQPSPSSSPSFPSCRDLDGRRVARLGQFGTDCSKLASLDGRVFAMNKLRALEYLRGLLLLDGENSAGDNDGNSKLLKWLSDTIKVAQDIRSADGKNEIVRSYSKMSKGRNRDRLEDLVLILSTLGEERIREPIRVIKSMYPFNACFIHRTVPFWGRGHDVYMDVLNATSHHHFDKASLYILGDRTPKPAGLCGLWDLRKAHRGSLTSLSVGCVTRMLPVETKKKFLFLGNDDGFTRDIGHDPQHHEGISNTAVISYKGSASNDSFLQNFASVRNDGHDMDIRNVIARMKSFLADGEMLSLSHTLAESSRFLLQVPARA